MLFNIPIIGGSTGHAVGAVLAAILVGPWAAVLCVTIALVLQFFMFNDGGITTLGANCLNMAIIMPLVGYGVYRLISGASPLDSKIRWIAASLGGYVGINFAALSAGVMLGLQPLISHDSMGRALYAPFPLKIAVPAMLGGHMLFFGVFEAVATGLVVRYIQKAEPSLLRDTAFSRGLSPKSTAAEDAA
jgi:cobalt/nickel transport system permease protein